MKRQAEFLSLLDELIEQANSHEMAESYEAVSLLMFISFQACRRVEALALSSNSRNAKIVEEIAKQTRYVAFSADLQLVSPLKERTEKHFRQESRGDQLRRKLTASFHKKTALRIGDRTYFDVLNMAVLAFNAAVRDLAFAKNQPPALKFHKKGKAKFNPSPRISISEDELDVKHAVTLFPMEQHGLEIFLEQHVSHPVSAAIRHELLSPENCQNQTIWAEKFVDWYSDRHPWPFVRNGEISLEYERGKPLLPTNVKKYLKDPLHLIAWQRRNSLRKERNPWNALRGVARERFEALLGGKGQNDK